MLTNNDYRAATLQVYRAARHPVHTRFGGVPGTLPGMAKAKAFAYARAIVMPLPDSVETRNVRAAYRFYLDTRAAHPVENPNDPRTLWRDCYAMQRAGDLP